MVKIDIEVMTVSIKENFYNDIEKRAYTMYEQYKYLIEKGFGNEDEVSKYQLKFNFLNNLELGGKAWVKNNFDYIQINTGVIDNFLDYFYDLTKNETNKFLSRLPFNFEEGDSTSYEMIKFNADGTAILYDSKIIDEKLAGLLTIFVSRFIVSHELGHILNGHCKFLNSKRENSIQYIPMFSEDNNSTDNILSPLDFRTLEMDADAFAATDSIKNLIMLYWKFDENVNKDINIKPSELFYWWSFAIRSNFLITQKILNEEKYKPSKKHLPSVARWMLILSSSLDLIDKQVDTINFKDGDDKQKILQEIIDGYLYAEKCYNERFSTFFNCYEETKENKDFHTFVNETQQNWEIIREELDEFSRLILYKRQ